LRRAFAITALALAVVLGALWGFNAFRQNMMQQFFANNRPPPLAVNTEIATPAEFPRTFTAIGSVSAINWVTIAPEVDGRVTAFSFIPGGEVKSGELLVQLNDEPERAELASYRAQLRLADVALKRARELGTRGAAAQAQVDAAQSQYDVAAANITRLEALIAQKALRAPFDGVLGVRRVEVGQYLRAGDPTVTLTNVDNLFVEFTLPEQARPELALEQRVALKVDAYPGRTFDAVVAVIDPQIDMSTRTIKLQAVITNNERLLMPGMFANLEVMLPPTAGVITLPETALDYSLYGNTVYVVQDGPAGADGKPTLTAKRVAVTLGDRHDGRVAVLTGLKAGDRVVTTGLIKLFDGSQILLNETPTLVKPAEIPIP
ncbi:MAG: efflux RND transporter periplasmic adaptor subunit, partial [Rhodospirillaceae bacterium]|nr:efflux RND transporter periplasmic adaptor subunit [Rhodospirillaceae bacterium]